MVNGVSLGFALAGLGVGLLSLYLSLAGEEELSLVLSYVGVYWSIISLPITVKEMK